MYFSFFFDTLSLVTPLSLLISLSFLKPLSIVFQDWIWSICFNVVVCKRIQRKKEKFKEKKEKELKREEKKECQKEENKKGSYQILRSEMEGRNTTLKKKSWKKKICWMKIPKRVDIPTNLENTSNYLSSPIFISFPLLLPYITS